MVRLVVSSDEQEISQRHNLLESEVALTLALLMVVFGFAEHY